MGDFDPAVVERALTKLLGDWTAAEKYEPIVEPFVPTRPAVVELATPDKANAWMGSGVMLPLLDSAPEYPALMLASIALGGSPSARLFESLREKKGLSYGAYAMLHADAMSPRALMMTNVIYAPENVSAVEEGLKAELTRWPSISQAELEHVRGEVLETRAQGRGNDDELAGLLAGLSSLGRTIDWEAKLDEALKSVTAEQANAAVKKHVDPASFVLVKAGDFRPVSAPR